jgi:hypothetical protein
VVERDPARLPAAGPAQAHREHAHQLHRKVRSTLLFQNLFTSCRILFVGYYRSLKIKLSYI